MRRLNPGPIFVAPDDKPIVNRFISMTFQFAFPAEADWRQSDSRRGAPPNATAGRARPCIDRPAVLHSERRLLRVRPRVVVGHPWPPHADGRSRTRESRSSVQWRDDAHAVPMPQESSGASRHAPPLEQSPRCFLLEWNDGDSPLDPLDECRRYFVAYDHHAQDAIVVEERRGARSGCRDGRVTSPRRRESTRRAASHRGDQSEHVGSPKTVSFGSNGRRCPGLHSAEGADQRRVMSNGVDGTCVDTYQGRTYRCR